jgi:hypothetical protein
MQIGSSYVRASLSSSDSPGSNQGPSSLIDSGCLGACDSVHCVQPPLPSLIKSAGLMFLGRGK